MSTQLISLYLKLVVNMKTTFVLMSVLFFCVSLTSSNPHDSDVVNFFGQQENPPNIIFIMADDLGYGDLGSYGQDVIKTPRLDQMAKEGLRFTQFYAGHTVCAPTRSALMTGQHTGKTRVRGNRSATGERVSLEPQDTTVAEVLQQAGYITGIIGKWGLGEPETSGVPNKKGFDYFWGFLNQARAHTYYPEWLWLNTERVRLEGNEDGKREQYSHDLDTKEAMNFIRKNAEEQFFLYLPYQIPHAELLVPKNALEDYLDENGQSIFKEESYEGMNNFSAQEMPNATYAAMVSRMDRDVGRLIDLLRELEIDDNTIVFFTSDNGPHEAGGYKPEYFNSSGSLRGIKRDLYEGGIRVPMIAWMPGTIVGGEVSDQVWSMWDFMPTAAEIGRAESPKDIDGISMVNALLNQPQQDPEYLYWEFHEGRFAQAVRFEDWKAVRNDIGQPIELYNLSVDIGENNDISRENPDIVNRAKELFHSARSASEHYPVAQLE
ncbi:MAG: arylsulfatase [Balneolales bacterium]